MRNGPDNIYFRSSINTLQVATSFENPNNRTWVYRKAACTHYGTGMQCNIPLFSIEYYS